MTTLPHAPPAYARRSAWLEARDLWTTLCVVVIWLAVVFVGIFGPDFVSAASGTTTTIPSGVGVAFFAMFATVAVARYGFGRRSRDD